VVCFGVFLEWRRGVVCGERNDVNHFLWERWRGKLGKQI
jgi:hypothetical protein